MLLDRRLSQRRVIANILRPRGYDAMGLPISYNGYINRLSNLWMYNDPYVDRNVKQCANTIPQRISKCDGRNSDEEGGDVFCCFRQLIDSFVAMRL